MVSIADNIKRNEEELKELTKSIEEVSQELAEWNGKRADCSNKIKGLEEQIAEQQHLLQEARIEIQTRKNSQQNAQQRVAELEGLIQEDRREKAIQELLSEQKGFWELAAERLATLMEGLNTGLEGFEDNPKKPGEVIEFLRAEKDNVQTFNRRSVKTHEAITHYTNCLRKLCEMRIDKRQIPPQEKQARLEVIDRYFNSAEIVTLWS